MSKLYAGNLVKIAQGEVGYKEKKTNSNLYSKDANSGKKNFNKYGYELANANWFNSSKNGYDWCTSFASWCFYMLANKDVKTAKALCYQPENSKVNYAASCTWAVKYYKNNKAFFTVPKVGDQIFFNWSGDKSGKVVNHTGIVVKIDGTKVYTIEGNSKQNNAEGVFEHSYALSSKYIVGYGRPKYDAETVTASKPAVTTTVQKPTTSYKVKVIAKDGLNIRSGAGTNFKKLGAMPKNAVVTVTKTSSGWGYGSYGKITGWFMLQWTTKL